jgi:hypothetical protein
MSKPMIWVAAIIIGGVAVIFGTQSASAGEGYGHGSGPGKYDQYRSWREGDRVKDERSYPYYQRRIDDRHYPHQYRYQDRYKDDRVKDERSYPYYQRRIDDRHYPQYRYQDRYKDDRSWKHDYKENVWQGNKRHHYFYQKDRGLQDRQTYQGWKDPGKIRINEHFWSGDFDVLDARDGRISFRVPTNLRQLENEKIDLHNLRLNSSIAYKDHGARTWNLIPEKDYTISTKLKDGNLIGEIKVPELRDKLVYPRIWVDDKSSDKWGWIDQSSKFSRNNLDGNPSYEFIYDPVKGSIYSPSEDLPVRP